MRIHEVVLPARDLDAVARFYRDVLELEVTEVSGRVTVRIGWTTVVFEPGEYAGAHHLAITIPTGTFAEAKAWIADRAELLDRDGVDEFEGPPGWESRSVYFDGPEGQVLELIERRMLPGDPAASFALSYVSEVGVAVPDAVVAAAQLADAGLEPFANPPAPGFAPVGTDEGMLILVAAGRAWLPTADRLAEPAPVTIRADVAAPVTLGEGQRLLPLGA